VLVAPPPEHITAAMDSSGIAVSRVLAPVDFNDECTKDVRTAADIAHSLGAPLLLVHVVAPLKGLERLRPQLDTHNRLKVERAEQQIQRLVSDVSMPVAIDAVVAVGSPAEEIAQIAIARGVGLIVMGLRRQEHVFGPRPGSIAYRVLGLAPAMVLALPPGEPDADWQRPPARG
jgi:nucleotide-binding universal stress UspA family protein